MQMGTRLAVPRHWSSGSGDGCLMVPRSPVDTMKCAVAIQRRWSHCPECTERRLK